jgi:hypothetical protein
MSKDVDIKIASLDDWRGDLLARIRKAIRDAVPSVVQEVKWRKASNPLGVPTWSCGGIICTGESYKDKVKLTFMHGNALADPDHLFTDEPTGTRRVIDFRRNDPLDAGKLARLVRAAADYNSGKGSDH